AVDTDGVQATNAATAHVTIRDVLPQIAVAKSASQNTVHSGDPVTYSYSVTNPGTEPLLGVTVTDDKCSPVTFVSGDTNTDSILQSNETWKYSCTQNLTTATTNTSTASGHDDENNSVQATSPATVNVIRSA